MSAKIIVDPGSTHFGIKDNCYRIIDAAKENGADAVKFQLFKDIPPNIPLPYEWWPDIAKRGREAGIEVFASVWDRDGIDLLAENGAKSVKFSYSQSQNIGLTLAACGRFETEYFSYDMMNHPGKNSKYEGDVWLYCVPEYPVRYQVSFDGVFSLFDGFSDHTLSIHQSVNAFCCGAKCLEKHFSLNRGIGCPDQRFAITPDELKQLSTIITAGK